MTRRAGNKEVILWLGPVCDDATVLSSLAVSPAGNRWQLELIHALEQVGAAVSLIGHLPEQVWPRGRLRVKPRDAGLPVGIRGQMTGYWNLPYWRNRSLSSGYRNLIRRIDSQRACPAVLVTYNGSPANVAGATYARKRYGIPWVCVVADDFAPRNANGYVFLSWGYYGSFRTSTPRLHLDGGVSAIRFSPKESGDESRSGRRIVMFAGSITRLAGADFLAQAFHRVEDPEAELWICGKGSNGEVERLAACDSRIKLWGMVSEKDLVHLAGQASIFVNPRPSRIPENERNFPSKILEYLSYGKPVISTWTAGLSPEYRDVLVPVREESVDCLAETIDVVLNWDTGHRQALAGCISQFLESRMWLVQSSKLMHWIRQAIIGGETSSAVGPCRLTQKAHGPFQWH